MSNDNLETPKSPLDYLKGIYEKSLDAIDQARNIGKGKRQQVDPSSGLVVLDEEEKNKFETPKSIWGMNFDLSQYLVKDAKQKPVISDKAIYFLNGSVDRTGFDKDKKREKIIFTYPTDNPETTVSANWYEDKKTLAVYFLKYTDRIDTVGFSTMEGSKKPRMLQIIKAISEMNDYTDRGWKSLITLLRTNNFSDEEIFGPEGACNLLLAFGRAAGNINLEADARVVVGKNAAGKIMEVPVYYKFNLRLAKNPGDQVKDRYGRIVEVKVKDQR